MRQSIAGLALWGGVSLWLGGCAHAPHTPQIKHPVQVLGPEDFWADQAKRRDALKEFTGQLRVAYKAPRENVSGSGRIVGRFPNDYRLELRDAFGRVHYVLVAQGPLVHIQLPGERRVLRDTLYGRAYFQNAWGAPQRFVDLGALYMGLLPQAWEKSKQKLWEWDGEQGSYRGVWQQGSERMTVWVDSATKGLRRVLWERNQGPLAVHYADQERVLGAGGFVLSHSVRLYLAHQNTQVEVNWKDLTVPKQPLPARAFEFAVPAGHRVQTLKSVGSSSG